jgi:hypothetical protein
MNVTIVRLGFLDMQVCATKDCTEPFIEEEANRLNPTCIESTWHIRRHMEPVFCQCDDDADRHHVILEC